MTLDCAMRQVRQKGGGTADENAALSGQ